MSTVTMREYAIAQAKRERREMRCTEPGYVIGWAKSRAIPLTMEELESATSWVGRVPSPLLMLVLHRLGLLSDEAYRLTGSVWCDAEFPSQALTEDEWSVLFERAGYCVDGVPSQRPTAPLRLWRGSVEERRLDWSWTDDIEVARQFAAGGLLGRAKGHVWTALVEPYRLLARNNYRNEGEFVVNTRGLGVTTA